LKIKGEFMNDIGMIEDNRGRKKIHGGKPTHDAQYAAVTAMENKYDREGFPVDTTPYEAQDPMGA
jgi:hypothetical protein